MIVELKNRVKVLEKEANKLRVDNRSLQDVENKLKDANQEISKLMSVRLPKLVVMFVYEVAGKLKRVTHTAA